MGVGESLDEASYGSSQSSVLSGEQMALANFVNRLGSWNCTEEPGIADERSTRNEATLLMSLLETTPKLDSDENAVFSSSDSERSLVSESSSLKRHVFSFTCPSLSLESAKSPPSPTYLKGNKRLAPRRVVSEEKEAVDQKNNETPSPATLLGRTLKVDDADALRLSADAMARNVLQSYQKAIHWRIQTWVCSLSKTLVLKEREMLRNGAGETELKDLLHTREALLLVALKDVSKHISVTGSGTAFRVLPIRVDTESDEPSPKRQRSEFESSDFDEMDNYSYTVTHSLVLECVINLDTPAGYSEITLQVPGTIEGTFISGEPGMEEIKSVEVELNTDILSAMIEKSCRTVVRASVESALQVEDCDESQSIEPAEGAHKSVSDEEEAPTSSLTPSVTPFASSKDNDNGHEAAIVTPRNLFYYPDNQSHNTESVMLPIPDDLDDKTTKPRRISPISTDQDNMGTFIAPHTPMRPKRSKGLPLISPPLNESQEYHEVPSNGPSLPVLVEVACRAMEGN